MSGQSQEQVVERAQAGDRVAFGALVERHSRDVFRLAFRITGNEQDAEDAVQETFLKAYQRLASFEARANFSTWLYRVTSNTAIDVLRRRKRLAERSSPEHEPELESAASVAPRQEGHIFGGELRDRIDGVLTGLSELERSAFVLRHYQECSIDEICGALDVSTSGAKQAIFRAVRKVRRALEPVARTTI